jgi:hypothetical protein
MTLSSCGQTKTKHKNESELRILAKLVSFDGGDKLHSAKFKVIKCLSDSVQLKDTINVWYYNYLQPDNNIDTVLLTLNKYDKQSQLVKDNLHCVDNDGKKGIKKAKIEIIDFSWWEGCDMGTFDYKPWIFEREKTDKNWYLIFPCGGIKTEIKITGQNFNKELSLTKDECPPYLEITDLPDGKYLVNMLAFGNGGHITFNLKTRTENKNGR